MFSPLGRRRNPPPVDRVMAPDPQGFDDYPGTVTDDGYRPWMSAEHAETLRRWHESASLELHALGPHEVTYLGVELTIPEHVFPPAPMSQLLGRAVVAE